MTTYLLEKHIRMLADIQYKSTNEKKNRDIKYFKIHKQLNKIWPPQRQPENVNIIIPCEKMLFSMCEKKCCESEPLNYTIQFLSEKLLLPLPPLPRHSCLKVTKRYTSSTSLNATFLNISGWRGCLSRVTVPRQAESTLYATGGSAHGVAHLT